MKRINKIVSVTTALGSALLSAAALAQTAAPAAAPSPFTGKVALYSEYEYRGISQTSEKPALQLNLDFADPSGFYLGAFASNIKWIKDTAKAGNLSSSSNLEIDLYGGFKTEISKDVMLDVGVLTYIYPSSSGVLAAPPKTTEIYGGLTSGAFGVKYSHAVSNTFGNLNSKNSGFIEANWTQEIAPKLVANAQLARQVIKNGGLYSYTVYKVGLTYDLGDGWSAMGYFKGTNVKKDAYVYLGKDWGESRLVIGVSKAF